MRLLIIAQKVDQGDDVLGFFHNWVRKISPLVENLDVLTLSVGSINLQDNVECHSLGKDKGNSKIIQAIKFYFFLLKILPNVDGVFVHMAPEYVRALYPLNIFFRKPVFMWYAHIHVSKTARWALDHVEKVFTPSKESFDFDSEKVISTGHGIDVELFKPQHFEIAVPTITTISRLSKVKRIEVLIEALRIIKEGRPGMIFSSIIVGKPAREEDPSYQSNLKTLAEKGGVSDHIKWIGGVRNAETPKIYNSSSVFVRLQGGGGFGKTELEAMACGVPVVICTDVYNSLLGEFKDDLYFPEDDSKRCAQNILKVLDWDVEKRKRYALLARNIVVERHNIDHLAKRIVDEFKMKISK